MDKYTSHNPSISHRVRRYLYGDDLTGPTQTFDWTLQYLTGRYLTGRASALQIFSTVIHVKIFRDKSFALSVFVIPVFVHLCYPISLLLQPVLLILIACFVLGRERTYNTI